MPRFLMLVSLYLLIAFTLVGGLIAREWGWREYASDELYVVYYQITTAGNEYFIINADGSSTGTPLIWNGGRVAKVDCSADGRTFAFLDDSGHLYVLTRAGIQYESAQDRLYTTVNVANDGTTALYDPAAGWLLLNSHGLALIAPDQLAYALDRVDISSAGLVLWNRHFEDIQVISPDEGEVVSHVAHGHSGVWLASEQMFTFYELITNIDGLAVDGGQYIMDVTRQQVIRIGGWTISRPLSPDGTKVAGALVNRTSSRMAQVMIYDLFTNQPSRQLTHDPEIASQPICFLAFRPEMLINGQ